MATYNEDELFDAILERVKQDEEFAETLQLIRRRKKRGWLLNLVADTARFLFGPVISGVVERVVDWFIDRFW